MTSVMFHLRPEDVPSSPTPGELHVLLYGGAPVHSGTAAIGGQVRDILMRFGLQPSVAAVDFLSIALAVTAADTFILRENSDNGWSRDISIVLPLHSPGIWSGLSGDLERALGFLSGDIWKFQFLPGGERPPTRSAISTRHKWVDVSKVGIVSLFSGGLDSTISTLNLLGDGGKPLLVSHAYTRDAQVQQSIASILPTAVERMSVNFYPTWDGSTDITMRTRSFNFIALAVLAGQIHSSFRGGRITEILVPENGLIALNAPLTPRRIGALSTRTTHPYFLQLIGSILERAGFSVAITNPYEMWTKGEMVASKADYPDFERIAADTVSCGKWKRTGKQCGCCVPCLIRRASLYAGGVDDDTDYRHNDLSKVMSDEDDRDDLIAMATAVRRLKIENLDRWVARSGPLPADRRRALVDVHKRGLTEVSHFLQDSGLPV
ncbi:hypothetical protein LJR231_002794 [Phyllobacterium sp. LjRoot231]|uniref:Qat anti-phage system QueC-like protein QatC n=1 Tax=Phyllobacterium sp. LjRoot231 TaxID=3342289 RepID=UPI003ECEDB91